MKAIMNDGTIEEIDTSFMFDNQYNTIDGERIHDTDIKQIIDDVRLGEFYCCSKKQGTYEEVQKAIDEERSHIHDCKNCFWYGTVERVKEKCHKEKTVDGDEEIIVETTTYKKGCRYVPQYSEKCVYDIKETPKLFRDVQDCFFCKHPEGIPNMTDFIHFMIDNHEKYGIVPYWLEDELSYDTSFKYNKTFGSYAFVKQYYSNYFELSNARHSFKFIYDFNNKKFILVDGIGYKEVKTFTTNEYDYKTQKGYEKTITNFDKFSKWFFAIVDDFIEATK
jgi:hypothetical protein